MIFGPMGGYPEWAPLRNIKLVTLPIFMADLFTFFDPTFIPLIPYDMLIPTFREWAICGFNQSQHRAIEVNKERMFQTMDARYG